MALTYKNKPVALVQCNDEYLTKINCNDDAIWEAVTPNEYFNFHSHYDGRGQLSYSVEAKNVEDMPEFVYIPRTYEGVKVCSIKAGGFRNCKTIKILAIPDNIDTIESEAFKGCKNLTSVVLLKGSDLKHINDEVFRGCSALKSINLEDAEHLLSIGEFAFANCGFESIFIPEGVTRIEKSTFRWCDNLTSVIMPDTISYIGNRAFSCCYRLEEIFLSEKVEEIGYGAFAHCHSLTIYCEQEDKPKGWKTGWNISLRPIEWGIGGAFDYTLLDDDTYEVTVNLKSHLPDKVVIPNTYNGKPVTRIGEKAFYQWGELINKYPYDNIDSVVIPDGITTIGDEAFRACRNLKSVIISNTVTSIGKRAFQDCKSLTTVNIPNSVTSIDNRAFQGCKKLREITIPDSVTTMGAWIFAGCNKITIYCETQWRLDDWDVWWNGSNIFVRCKTEYLVEEDCKTVVNNLTVLKYKNKTAKIIGYDDESATRMIIEIPSNVDTYQITSIGDNAFKECKMLQRITFAEGSQLTHIGNYAFYGCPNLTSIEMPSGVTKISDSAFAGCFRLQTVTFGEGYQLKHIGNNAFDGCSALTSITISDGVIDNGDIYIGDKAFNKCNSLSTVVIPANVTLIGESAFNSCINLRQVTFGTNSKLAFIDSNTFANCSSLTSITMPNNISGIGYGAFSSCSGLISITIPANVISIGDYAFKDCTNLISVTFADIENSKLQSIGYEAFAGCNMSEIELPNGLDPNNTSSDAFDKDVEINGGVNGNALVDLTTGTLLTAFNSTTISNILTNIGERAFSGITGIMNLIIPENITTIATEAFLNCLGLREIFIPTSVKYMQANAFKGCTGLTIKCAARKQPDTWDDDWNPDNLPVEWGCYEKTASDELFIYELLSDNTYSIKAKDKDSLSGRIVIPASYQGVPVTKIATNGFSGANISWVDVLSGIKTIEYGAFKNCSILLDINFPETLEYIGADAFYGCENLTLIQLPNSIKTIETWAFRDCDKAKNIYIPNGVEMINNGAFIGVNVDERTIWCENTEAEVSAKGWNTAWNAKDITGIGKFPVTYNAAAITDSSKFEFRTTMDGNYYVKPKSSDLVIVNVPSSYNNIPVTEIGSFSNCKSLVKVILPDSITRLRVNAFAGCKNLNEITLPESLKKIEDAAFLESAITSIVIPDTVEQTSLTEVFKGCANLRHITLPDSWTTIGNNMFEGCVNLTDIVLPNNCNYIESGAFSNCENLQNVYLYNKQWKVGDDTYLNLSDKSAADVAQLLTSSEYNLFDWNVKEIDAPILTGDLDKYFVEFTVENPNNTPQIITVSLSLKDGSTEVYHYSESYTISANQSISEMFDMPSNADYTGVLDFTYLELTAHFELGNETKVLIDPALGHNYVGTIVKPTCTEQGYTNYVCSECGDTYKDNYVDALGHTYDEGIVVTPATCKEDGLRRKTCQVCGHILEEVIPRLGGEHTYDVIDTPPTCTEAGYSTYTCTRCGHSYTADPVEPLGHAPSDWIIDVRPTGTTEGSKHKECTRCGEILETATIAKLGNADEYLTYTLLDSSDGYSVKATYLDYLPNELTIPSAFNGKPVTVVEFEAFANYRQDYDIVVPLTKVILPDSIKAILGDAFCDCANLVEINIPIEVEYIGTDAFSGCDNLTIYCEASGQPDTWEEDWNSSNCNVVWSALCENGHTYGEWATITQPTCTVVGLRRKTCTHCGDKVDEEIPALGHAWGDWKDIHPAECEIDGTQERTCSRCGENEYRTIPATGHDWDIDVEVVPPTCTDGGYTIHTCNACGHTHRDNFTDPLGHISSDWIIDVEPTTETEGSKHKECTRCGVVLETAVIERLPSEDTVNYLTNREGSYLSDNNGNLLIVGNAEATYLIDEDGNHITDEQGNLLIL